MLIEFKWTNQIFLMPDEQGIRDAGMHDLTKPVDSKAKTSLHIEENLQYRSVKMPSSSNKTATTAASTLMITSCISPLSSAGAFRGNSQQWLPGFVAT